MQPNSESQFSSECASGTSDTEANDLKQKTVHGALVAICTQAVKFLLRAASLMVLARLLTPEDFGLVGMVIAVTAVLNLCKEVGLPAVTVQRASITQVQMSTLFWINLGVGVMLTILCAAFAPALAAFYREPRVTLIAVVLGLGFFLGGASAQHYAILQRRLRFLMLSIIEIASLVLGLAISVGMAAAGQGYWALVALALMPQAASALGTWLASGWVPGMPRRLSETASMLRFGGTATLNLMVGYVGRNAEKILLGRFWGAETLGIYGRGYQIINLPTDNLNDAIGAVAFPALARVQHDPQRLRSYFLKGFSLFLSLVMPITMAGALFADDIILVFLGPKWREVASLLRLMAPAAAAWGLIHPFGWLLLASGRVGTNLKIALILAPVVIVGYVAGLAHGPQGVAVGYSIAMILMIAPVVRWSTHSTLITTRDTLRAVTHPLLSVLIGAAATLAFRTLLLQVEPALLRLTLTAVLFYGVYSFVLLFVLGRKSIYISLFREAGLWPVPRPEIETTGYKAVSVAIRQSQAHHMKVITVVGARPNFMKAAPLLVAINEYNKTLSTSPADPHKRTADTIQHILVHTGQHYDELMSGSFFRDLKLPKPDVHLGVGSRSHAVQTAEIMRKFEGVLLEEKPDVVVVVGDVNSTLACALVAAKIPSDSAGSRPLIAHVEAGLRSFDRSMPEEINRILTDHVADLLFVTEESGLRNLRHEGIAREKIHFVGNTMIDCLLAFRDQAEASTILQDLGLRTRNGGAHSVSDYMLLTLHRPTNVDTRSALVDILAGLEELAADCPIVFPVHPRTRQRLREFGLESQLGMNGSQIGGSGDPPRGIILTNPLSYLDFVCLMKHARLVVTDSGGIQEETTCLQIPCVTVRENTERPVTVESGTNMLAGTRIETIKAAIRQQLERKAPAGMPNKWDGHAARRIVEVLVHVQHERLVGSAQDGQ